MSSAKARVRQRIAAICMSEDNMMFKKIWPATAARRKAINDALYDIGKTYHSAIPMNDMFAILKKNGFEAVDEDGTPWSGFLTGRDGKATIDLVDLATDKPAKNMLVLTWHKMESGRYEVVAYIS